MEVLPFPVLREEKKKKKKNIRKRTYEEEEEEEEIVNLKKLCLGPRKIDIVLTQMMNCLRDVKNRLIVLEEKERKREEFYSTISYIT